MNIPRRSAFTRAGGLSVAMAALVVGAYSLTGRLISSGTDFNGLWAVFPFLTLAIAAGFAVLGRRVGLARPYTWAFGVAASLVPLLALYSAYSSTHYTVAPDLGLRRVGHLVGVLIIEVAIAALVGALIHVVGERFGSLKPFRTRGPLLLVAIAGVVVVVLAIHSPEAASGHDEDRWLCTIAALSEFLVVLAIGATVSAGRRSEAQPRERLFDLAGGAFFVAASLLMVLALFIPPGKYTLKELADVHNRFFHPLLDDERRACAEGNAWYCREVGTALYSGEEVPRDRVAALIFFRKACDLDDFPACVAQGTVTYDLKNNGGTDDDADAAFQRACDGSFAEGCTSLGQVFDGQRGGVADPVRATKMFEKACTMQSDQGCLYYALALLSGRGIAADPARATKLLLPLCQRRIFRACTPAPRDKLVLTQRDLMIATNLTATEGGLYWVVHTNDGKQVLEKVVTSATVSPAKEVELSTLNDSPWAMVADSNNVYWSDGKGLHRVPASGGPVDDFSSNLAESLALDNDYIYWSAQIAQSHPENHWSAGAGITRRNKSTGETQTVFADRKAELAQSMAVDGERVYWAGSDHTLMATAKDGSGHPVELARSDDFITSIQVSNTDVLWLSHGSIYRVSKEGGASARLATRSGFEVRGFAVGAAGVFACIEKHGDILALGALEQLSSEGASMSRWNGQCMAVTTDAASVYFEGISTISALPQSL